MTESSSAFRSRQRLVGEPEHLAESSTGDDERKPLTPAVVRRRLTSNLANMMKQVDREEEISCFGDLWRLVASGLLGLLLISPFLYSFYQYETLPTPTFPSDLLPCAQDYNFSFALLYRSMELATHFCDDDLEVCTCSDPLQPLARVPSTPHYFKAWDDTFARNVKMARGAQSPKIVLYGDSITEHWVGTDLGTETQDALSVNRQFQAIFDQGQAIALGIAGDRTPQLSYRLRHGELPEILDPPIFWILIGTNDLADHCSPEAILVGIIHVAQYIQFRRPSARVVINGILPKPNPASRKWEGTRYYSAIAWINDKLHCYAQGLENVEYFDASNLFSDENGLIKEDLMPDGVHPSGKGARIWGEAILQRLEQILDQGHTMENDETR